MNIKQASKAHETILNGGLAIIPSRVGYTLLGNSEDSLHKMFRIKGRPLSKPCVVLTNRKLLNELALTSEVNTLIDKINDHKLLCGFILPRKENKLYTSLTSWTNYYSQHNGTSCFVINAGEYIDYLVNRAYEDCILIVGSSANQSGTGNEGVFLKIPEQIRKNVDFSINDDNYVSKEYNPITREQGVMIEWLNGKPVILRRGLFIDKIEEILKDGS